jgi:hypothetical protein
MPGCQKAKIRCGSSSQPNYCQEDYQVLQLKLGEAKDAEILIGSSRGLGVWESARNVVAGSGGET